MPLDSNLLKEAIADAKAVRQTALANAKVALEEAFSERYHAMFAEKLKEDATMGNPAVAAPAAPNATVKEEETVSEQEIDELIKELEAEVGDEAPEGLGDAPAADAAPAHSVKFLLS
jgi:cell division protein FtsB